MKKLLSTTLVLVIVLILSNCTKDCKEKLDITIEQSASEFVVPIDSALLYLSDFMNSISVTKNYRLLKPQIKNIQTVKFNKQITKTANNMAQEGDNLMYLVNFNDDQGYAILSADTRIETPVLAFAEKGSISANDFNRIYDMRSQGEEQEREPDPEPEPTPTPNHDKSFIINIEGEDFDLYCSDCDDYYVGGSSDINVQQQYLLNMVDSYARKSVIVNTESQYHRVDSSAIVEKKVLLTTKWHQDSPYNDFSPIKGGTRSPAGCVAIALGQIWLIISILKT